MPVRGSDDGAETAAEATPADATGAPPDAPESVDVLALRFPEFVDREDEAWTVPAGYGADVVAAHEAEAARRERIRTLLGWLLATGLAAVGWLLDYLPLGVGAGLVVLAVFYYTGTRSETILPEVVATDVTPENATAMWGAEPRQRERERA